MNRSKQIGTAAESAVVRWLRDNGFPGCERRALAGAHDLGDIKLDGCPGLVIEVKGGKAAEDASDNRVAVWMHETDVERINARADVGVLVMKRRAFGVTRVGSWWAVLPLRALVPILDGHPDGALPVRMHLSACVAVLRRMGYGTPDYLTEPIEAVTEASRGLPGPSLAEEGAA